MSSPVVPDPFHVLDLLDRGEKRTAASLLDGVFKTAPARDDAVAQRLCYAIHMLLRHSQGLPVHVDVVLATRGPPADDRTTRVLQAVVALLQGSMAVTEGRTTDLVQQCRLAATILPPALPWLELCLASLLQAAFRFTGDLALEREALAACARMADRSAYPQLAVTARALMASVHLLRGHFHATLDRCEAALALANAAGADNGSGTALAHQFRGYVLFEWNRLAEADAALEQAWRLSADTRGVRSGVARMMAHVAAARHDAPGAELWLNRLTEIVAEPMTLRNREWLTAVRVRHTLGRVDLRSMEHWLRAYDYRELVLSANDHVAIMARLDALDTVLAMLELTGQWAAICELAPRIADATADRRIWFEARARSTEAVALEALGQSDQARRAWLAALHAGEAGSFLRVYIEGSSMRHRLIERLAASPDAPPQLRALHLACQAQLPRNTALLTPKQVEVLRLVMQGHSNKAIAQQLQLSLSTVKTHLRVAFTRLGARSRTQAIAQAHKRGLLEAG